MCLNFSSRVPVEFNISLNDISILHAEDFFVFTQIFILYHFFTGLAILELFELFMKAMTGFDDGNPCTTNKFYEAIGFESFYQGVNLFAMATCLKHDVIC